jgi:uncharacterized Ntn-hydrolase superfamily protein
MDTKTGEIVIASATCVPQERFAGFPARGLMDVQAIVVPGKGVAAAPAGVDRTRKNQELIYRELQKGTHPDTILLMLKEDPAIESRQFGIVDGQLRSTGFSGSRNGPVSLSMQGRVPGSGHIVFSVQGNILASDEVVYAAARALQETRGDLTDRVLAAITAADLWGGDRRCTCDAPPPTAAKAACTRKTANVAYMLLADATDPLGGTFNDGKYTMFLDVTDQNITAAEDANPVATLEKRYQAWKSSRRSARE